ncbi:integrase, catalytic region, zinc finger, CCHC-type containing protein [Tanacetum coccineum]
MYKVGTSQVTNTNKSKSVLSSTGLSTTSSVRRPSNRDSSFKNSVVSNTENSSKIVEVYDRTNKKPYVASKNVGLRTQSLQFGQFCDGDLKVAFCSKTCYVRNMEGYDLLTGDRESNLYTISIPDMASSSLVCLMSKASSTKSWLWHRRLSHLNFGTINDLTKHDLVDGLPKFKYAKDHLCSAYERGKSRKTSHPPKLVPSSHSKLELLHMDLCGPMRVASINGKKKPNVEYFYVFGSLCYPINDRDDLGKMKPEADIGIFIGYSKTSRGFQIYNRRTKKIMETIHVKFDELTTMASKHDSLEPVSQRFINDESSAESMNTPSKEDLDNLFGLMFDEYFEKKSSDMPINSAAQQVHNYEDSPVTTSIDIEADESYQEDSAEFDGNTLFTPYDAPDFSKAESSTALDPSNMHEFHQVQPSTHIWIKAHPLEQVIGDPSKPVMTRQRL